MSSREPRPIILSDLNMPETTGAIIAAAVAALKRGEVIVFPTETLYGLGADALNAEAVDAVFRLKGRDPTTPIPVLIADLAMLGQLVDTIPPLARQVIERFWPGPVTLVLPARTNVPKHLLNSAGGLGIRVSSQAIARRLVEALGGPLTATSANPSGAEPARTLLEAKNYFSANVNTFIDGGTLISRTGSTVVEVQGERLKIIREGDIAAADLEQVLGKEKLLR